ncbi:MAG: phosphoribosylanthranilate isomerase [Alphaproteobacteria bacterium]|nr:phosphoribosylanthranilate isomerase [Alphaproteobacteria bacterium]
MTSVKICGLSTPETLACAVSSGARYVGFVFYPPSPRNVSFDIAWNLARAVPTGVRSVGLFVNPSDEELERILTGIQLDMVQLHGDESPGRINEIKERFSMPVIKAIRVASEDDLSDVEGYESAADWLLFDAKPAGAKLPGGTGESFDWNILKDRDFKKPWMLSGGLDASNVKDALNILKPNSLDISSGVESAPGIKDTAKIKSFIDAVKAA